MEQKKKKREVGIELLRIITMLMIILLHFCEKPGFIKQDIFYNKISEIGWFLTAFASVAVNCYILISGYFLIRSECKTKKVINIWKEVFFYSVSIFLLFSIFTTKEIHLKESITYFLPITFKLYWFISIYVVLYLLAPFINKCLLQLEQKDFKKLLIILLAISWGSSLFRSFGFDTIDSTNGYGVLRFVTLYCIGAYIRLFSQERTSKKKSILIYIGISILIYLLRVLLYKLCQMGIINSDTNCNAFYKYNSITITFSSIYLFLFFKKVNIKNKIIENSILKIAPLTLAVYIIHETPLIRAILYKDLLRTDSITRTLDFIIELPIACLGIFIVCCLIEVLRINIFKMINYIFIKIKNRRIEQ